MRVPAALGRGAAGRAAPGAGGTTRSLIVGGMKGRSWDVKAERRCTAAPVHSRCQSGRIGTWYMGLTRALSLPDDTWVCVHDSRPRTLAGGGDFIADRLLFMTDARESRILHCHGHLAPSRQSPYPFLLNSHSFRGSDTSRIVNRRCVCFIKGRMKVIILLYEVE